MVADVSPEGWREPVDMRYANTDTLTYRRLELTLAHSSDAELPDERFTLATISPSHVIKLDTLRMAAGLRIQNNGMQQTQATPLLVRLTESGEWRFVITPLQNTVGVWSVGIDFK
jgi:hypothetical protein